MLQELGRDDGADRVTAEILGAGAAAAVPEEAGHRVRAARLQVVAEDVALRHGPHHGLVPYDPETLVRVRSALGSRPGIVEKRMVGGRSFVVDGHLCCGVTSAGLLIRLGAEGVARALDEPYVQPMTMGGRTLAGFILVDPEGYADDIDLSRWVQRALDTVAGLP